MWLIVSIPLHELGHYIVAKKNKWQNIHFGIVKWHKIPIAFATIAENKYDIKSNSDFFKAYREISMFYAMGGFFSLMGIAFAYAFSIFDVQSAFLLFELMTVYLIWEMVNIKGSSKNEKQTN